MNEQEAAERLTGGRAKASVWLYLRDNPDSTAPEIAAGCDVSRQHIHSRCVELYRDGLVTRQKRQLDRAGNFPYEYRAVPAGKAAYAHAGQLIDALTGPGDE